MDRATILETARKYVTRDRAAIHGDAERNFERIAALWGAYHEGAVFGAEDVAVMLALVKVARIRSNPGHADNWVDMAGYAACGGEIATEKEQPATYFVKCDQHNWVWTVDSNGPHWQCADCGSRKYA